MKNNADFTWKKYDKTFKKLKIIFTKKLMVKDFDPKKDITDASEYSISGILSQERYPIMYLRRCGYSEACY